MPVPHSNPTSHRLLRWTLVCLFALTSILTSFPAARASGAEQPQRLRLEDYGFIPVSPEFLLNGSSMYTVHYVDDKHLLLTFVVKRLIRRLPNEPSDDMDRTVDAVLLELPSGKVLTRTSWHLHDHAQYLWSLGHGHFLLRIRDTLTTFAPLANLSTEQPFIQNPFLIAGERRIAAIIVSPDGDFLTVESVKPQPPPDKSATSFAPVKPGLIEREGVLVHFFRIHPSDNGGPVKHEFAGVVQTHRVGDVPASTAGYLAVVDQGRQHYAFDFHSYAGQKAELSPFDSSCPPAPIFVSHSEFIAFGCRNAKTMQHLGGFNMRGEEMWEQGLYGDYIAPHLSFAPAGGRFALSRIMLRTSAIPDQLISNDEISSQTVVVIQTNTGKQLLRADCSPVERAGQNFAFSPNGLSFAVIHADAIEIYNLPPLSNKDQAAVKLAETSAPPENNLPVHFGNQTADTASDSNLKPDIQSAADSAADSKAQSETPSEAQSDTRSETTDTQPAVTPTATPIQPSNSEAPATTLDAEQPEVRPSPSAARQTNTQSDYPADSQPGQHRSAPPLYNLPTDKDKAPTTPSKTTPQ